MDGSAEWRGKNEQMDANAECMAGRTLAGRRIVGAAAETTSSGRAALRHGRPAHLTRIMHPAFQLNAQPLPLAWHRR